MKNLLFFCVLFMSSKTFSQDLSYEDFKTLVPFLKNQDYKSAFEKSDELLKKSGVDTSDVHAQIAYINVYASAGMVTTDQMTYDDFEKNIKKFIGKKLRMPGHPCVSDSIKGAFNSFQFKTKKEKIQGYTMTANKDKTNILLFEYFDFDQPVNIKEFKGQNVRASGVLKSYEISPTKSKLWIARLHLINAKINRFVPF